jgi:hypothetical protein
MLKNKSKEEKLIFYVFNNSKKVTDNDIPFFHKNAPEGYSYFCSKNEYSQLMSFLKKNNKNKKNKKLSDTKSLIFKKESLSVNSKNILDNSININLKDSIKIVNKRNITNDILVEKEEKKEKLSDFEINDLDYFKALELDKRVFYQIYWAIIRREHIILFTFFSWKDYNLWYIKFTRFIFLISTDMAMNVFFFSDDSMHKLYLNYGKYDFIQQIEQIIYSTIISQLLEVFLCYLSLTDKHYYQIKGLKNEKSNAEIILKIVKCIKLKLIGFFIFTFILFLFYWYFISAFCAVYQNTQITFLKDSISSYITGLLYPFVLYLFPSALRIIALKDKVKKRLKCIYKLSNIIPFF